MLTDDDKQWMRGAFEEFKVSLRTDLGTRLEEVESSLRAEFGRGLEEVKTSLRTDFADRLEKVETTLLTEFHKWASPIEMRQRTHTATLRALDAETENLADRLKNLEGR